jgi:hypothetical protein
VLLLLLLLPRQLLLLLLLLPPIAFHRPRPVRCWKHINKP